MVRDDCKHYQPPSGWCDGDYCELRKDFFTPCDGCENYENKNKRTNAMKIRSMTDEELADMFEDYGDCPPIACPHDGEGARITRSDCRKCWLVWLREEGE